MAAIARQSSISEQILSKDRYRGLFPGWGTSRVIVVNCLKEKSFIVAADTNTPFKKAYGNNSDNTDAKNHPRLNALQSVSIAGCDLMGSCLYTAGICASYSGKVCYSVFCCCCIDIYGYTCRWLLLGYS